MRNNINVAQKQQHEKMNEFPVLSNVSYKKIYNARQDFFHLLVMQDFMLPRYKEILDAELISAIIDNSKMIYELIDSIDVALVRFHSLGAYQNMKKNDKH